MQKIGMWGDRNSHAKSSRLLTLFSRHSRLRRYPENKKPKHSLRYLNVIPALPPFVSAKAGIQIQNP
jgi:hypothetical protein